MWRFMGVLKTLPVKIADALFRASRYLHNPT